MKIEEIYTQYACAALGALIQRDTERGREELKADNQEPTTPDLYEESYEWDEVSKAAHAIAFEMTHTHIRQGESFRLLSEAKNKEVWK